MLGYFVIKLYNIYFTSRLLIHSARLQYIVQYRTCSTCTLFYSTFLTTETLWEPHSGVPSQNAYPLKEVSCMLLWTLDRGLWKCQTKSWIETSVLHTVNHQKIKAVSFSFAVCCFPQTTVGNWSKKRIRMAFFQVD